MCVFHIFFTWYQEHVYVTVHLVWIRWCVFSLWCLVRSDEVSIRENEADTHSNDAEGQRCSSTKGWHEDTDGGGLHSQGGGQWLMSLVSSSTHILFFTQCNFNHCSSATACRLKSFVYSVYMKAVSKVNFCLSLIAIDMLFLLSFCILLCWSVSSSCLQAFSAMEQLRTHCTKEISELERMLESQQELSAALDQTYPELVT